MNRNNIKKLVTITFISFILILNVNASNPYQWIKELLIEYRCKKISKRLDEQRLGYQFFIEDNGNYKLNLVTNKNEWFKRVIKPWGAGMKITVKTMNGNPCEISLDKSVFDTTILDNTKLRPLRKQQFQQGTWTTYPSDPLPTELRDKLNDYLMNFTVYECNCDLPPKRFFLLYGDYNPLELTYNTHHAIPKYLLKDLTLDEEHKVHQINMEFQTNQTEINDINPLWSWLKLNKSKVIDSVSVFSYASVDGNETKNIELAKARGSSIKNILIENGIDEDNIIINSSVNWILYGQQKVNDDRDTIQGLGSETWKPLLHEQRTCMIKLYYSIPKFTGKTSNTQLIKQLNRSILKDDYSLQDSLLHEVFRRIVNEQMPQSSLNEIKIMDNENQNFYFNQICIFKHYLSPDTKNYTLEKLEKLSSLLPKDPEINYYFTAKKIEYLTPTKEEQEKIKYCSQIKSLRRLGVPSAHVNRLLVNYYMHLIRCNAANGEYWQNAHYSQELYSLAKRNIKNVDELSDIAALLSSTVEYDKARKLLASYIKSNKYNNKMLKTYLWITIFDYEYYSDALYQNLVEQALQKIKYEVLQMIKPLNMGGTAFFLWDEPKYRELFCKYGLMVN